MTNGRNEVLISTAQGQLSVSTRRTYVLWGGHLVGCIGIRLRANDRVIGMDIVQEGSSIFVISRHGLRGKRTKVAQFTPHARGGVGIRSAVVNSKTGDLVSVKTLTGEMQESHNCFVSRPDNGSSMKDIPELGRATQGVRTP